MRVNCLLCQALSWAFVLYQLILILKSPFLQWRLSSIYRLGNGSSGRICNLLDVVATLEVDFEPKAACLMVLRYSFSLSI